MGWYTYFRLLEKYNGDLSKATDDEMEDAYLSNPNTPPRALEIAREKYRQEQNKKSQPDAAFCAICDKPLQPAPARFDGEPAIVGYLPCSEHPHAAVRYDKLGVVKNTMPALFENICKKLKE